MRFSTATLVVGLGLSACTVDGELATSVDESPVIGGANAPAGKWPDAVAVLWSGEQACTGTLIAPTVVLTAGHCVEFDPPNGVLVGASALSKASEGETIRIAKAIDYPGSQNSVDVGILVLEKPSTIEPRPIASGWARFDIKNGAAIELVGFGTIDSGGRTPTDVLQEATSTITDFNCTTSRGCNTAARPDGELGAGGMGIDTCPGDSGGPLYLTTDYGTFVAGVTSRAYDNARTACSEGGIYGRPDKIIDWIDQITGVKVARGPTPEAVAIMTSRGEAGETKITVNDPKSSDHTFAIVTPPDNGRAAVSESGTVRVCPNRDVVGDDLVVVGVTDAADPSRSLQVPIPILIADGSPPDDCDETAFGDDGGCCDSRRGAGGSIPLALIVLGLLGRRRRRE